jgi:transposase
MEYYAGIDVSLESSSICVVDGSGRIIREAKVSSEPDALLTWFKGLGFGLARIGLEAGPLSQWLYAGMRAADLLVELLETRHVRNAFKAMPVKTDRKDARGIAQLMRLGWFRPVHCKSLPAQELRAVLTARKLVQSKRQDVEMSLRGILRGFGLKVGPTTPRSFERRIRELVSGQAMLEEIADALLIARISLGEQLARLQKRLVSLARDDQRARLLMSAPGVGVLVALTYVAAIDDPGRFKSSRATGAHFGLTPKKYQSGETDVTGRISKIGDVSVRTALYEAANVIPDAAGKRFHSKELGDAVSQACWHAQGQGRSSSQTRSRAASDACRRHHLCRGESGGTGSIEGELTSSGGHRHQSSGEGPVARTMDQVRS